MSAQSTEATVDCTFPSTESVVHSAQRDFRTPVVSFQDPPPRPRRSSQRPASRSISASTSPSPSGPRSTSPTSPSIATLKETCGYCSDHGEMISQENQSHSSHRSPRRRVPRLSKASINRSESDSLPKKPSACCDGNNIFCMMCNNKSAYMPPDDPQVLLQVAQALERKARRDLFKAEVLRWRVEANHLDTSAQVPIPDELLQKGKKLGVDIPGMLLESPGSTPESSALTSPTSSERSTLPSSTSILQTFLTASQLSPPYSVSVSVPTSTPISTPQEPNNSDDAQNGPRPRSTRTLKKRRPEYADVDWPVIRRQKSSPAGIASHSECTLAADGGTSDEPKARRPRLRSFFSTRTGTQIIPFLRRSMSVHK